MRALSPADRTWGILVDGIGGIGKSAIAIEAAHLSQEKNLFDAFVFVTAKTNILDPSGIKELNPPARTLDEFLNETARVLGQSGIAKLTGDEKHHALLDVLRTMRTLLIYDNLETLSKEEQEGIADFLRELPQGCKAIITSRRRGGEGAVWLRVEKLDWDAARGIIENEMARAAGLANKLRRVESRWQELFDETNGSPLALVHTLGLMRVRIALTFDGALEMLRGNRDADLQKFIFQEARKELTENDKTALGALSFFVPSATFEAWMQVAKLSRRALETTINRLSALSLVDVLAGEECYTLHPLTRAFVRDELLIDKNVARETGMRFAQYWVDYADRHGHGSYKSYDQLEAEWTNLDITADWLWKVVHIQGNLVRDENAAKILNDLAHALSFYLLFGGRWDEGVEINEHAYRTAKALGDLSSASSFAYRIAWINLKRLNSNSAIPWIQRGEESAGDDLFLLPTAKWMQGMVEIHRKNFDDAERLLWEAIKLSPTDVDKAISFNFLGSLARNRKEYLVAEEYYKQAIDIARQKNQMNF